MPGGAVRVAVADDGNAWVINAAGNIYQWNGAAWLQRPGAATDIGAGGGETWVIGTNAVGGGNYGIYQYVNNSWLPVAGGGVRIAVNSHDSAWVLSAAGGIYKYQTFFDSFVPVPGGGVDVGGGQGWLVGANPVGGGNFGIYYFNGSDDLLPAESVHGSFDGVGGGAVSISGGGTQGWTPWVINSAGQIYQGQ
jgi:hypothetical protein